MTDAVDPTARKRPVAFLFAGHGGHAFQMARGLYETHASFRAWMETLERLVAPRIGAPVLAQLYDPSRSRAEPFDEVRLAHPAIFMVQYALARVMAHRFGAPDRMLGASLGELVAATLAGAVSLDRALDLVARHADLFGRHAGYGGMLAALAPREVFDTEPELLGGCAIATLSDPSHVVIAGGAAALDQARGRLHARGVSVLELPVRLPFHCAALDGLEAEVRADLGWRFGPPQTPVVSCASGAAVSDYAADNLWSVLRRPVRIDLGLAALEREGAFLCVDFSPGAAFAGALGRSRGPGRRLQALRLLPPFGDEAASFAAADAALAANLQPLEPAI